MFLGPLFLLLGEVRVLLFLGSVQGVHDRVAFLDATPENSALVLVANLTTRADEGQPAMKKGQIQPADSTRERVCAVHKATESTPVRRPPSRVLWSQQAHMPYGKQAMPHVSRA